MSELKEASGLSAAEQRALLKQFLRDRIEAQSEGRASSAQRRLWFLERMEGPSATYNVPCHVVLRGRIDVALLERSYQELVRRQSALRTAFHDVGGEPFQRVLPNVAAALPVTDLSSRPRDEAVRAAKSMLAEDARTPFDLGVAPLCRARLLKLAAAEHVLAFVLHHIVSDGWSVGVFVRDLFTIYEGLRSGRGPLPELPLTYLGYTARQARWLESEECARELSYWERHLADLPVLALPTDRARRGDGGHRGAMHAFTLDAQLTRALQELCKREGATLFMLLLAAFNVLLSKYSGQSDIVVGTPIANRSSVDTEGLIGFFANTLVMRNDLSGNPSFRELLKRVGQSALGAYANQALPFERLVEALRPDREAGRNPLFQVALALQNEPLSGIALDGLDVGRPVIPGGNAGELEIDAVASRFDMELHFWEDRDGLRGAWFYDAALFDAETVARMGRHFSRLAASIAEDPERRIAALDPLTPEERRQLLEGWARKRSPYPRDASIHELFERQCAQTPDAAALEYGSRTLTYAELDAAANRLARYLERGGVRPGALIGLCLERGAETIVAMLGILKAGCAYVPLDPEYPAARLAFMLEDAVAPVLVTERAMLARLPDYTGRVVELDGEREAILLEDASTSARSGAPTDLAYVIYTSGSTGTPKGVAVPHRAVVRLVRDTDYLQLGAQDRVVQASNTSFDAATFEIWGALLNGGCLVGAAREQTLVPAEYAAFLRARRISAMFITTALFNQMARAVPDAFSTLGAVLFGGEAVDAECVRRVLRSGRPRRLLHVYGPTESTTFASWFEVERVADDAITVPIGRPIANTDLYVLDAHGNPVPAGVVGELYVGGDGLAQGYWRRPDLTAERFVRNPHAPDGPELLYRTGDLVQWRRDGVVEFVGRIDDQVKLRGFRIELAEIEARLRECAEVAEAIVMLRETGGEKQLIAYVVPARRGILEVGAVKAHLQQALPSFMVPAAIVELEAMPLTKNGKVDRARLPEPSAERASGTTYVTPRTDTEQRIAAVWREVLELGAVGIDDNFFDLGGDSFRLVRVHAALQQALPAAADLPITELFRCSTIRALAQHLAEGSHDAGALAGVRERVQKQRAAMAQLKRRTAKE
jgi:amino acid adenylation domain-containing protein